MNGIKLEKSTASLEGPKAFDAAARAALAADNWPGMCDLVVELARRQRSALGRSRRAPTWGPPGEELLQVGLAGRPSGRYDGAVRGGGIEAAGKWWKAGKGSFYKAVGSAIYNAMSEYLRAGGRRVDNTWRGGYDSHTRKFSSQLPKTLKAFYAASGTDVEEFEASTELGADPRETRLEHQTAEVDRDATARDESRGNVSVSEGNAERIDWSARDDDERLNPKDDGDRVRGVDGATAGLHTGRMVRGAWGIAREIAWLRLTEEQRGLLAAVERAWKYEEGREPPPIGQRLKNYINAGRGRRAQEIRTAHGEALAQWNVHTHTVLEERGEAELVLTLGALRDAPTKLEQKKSAERESAPASRGVAAHGRGFERGGGKMAPAPVRTCKPFIWPVGLFGEPVETREGSFLRPVCIKGLNFSEYNRRARWYRMARARFGGVPLVRWPEQESLLAQFDNMN